jgi:hypothetical protein
MDNTKILPVMYSIKGQMIPGKLSLKERIVFAKGLGLNHSEAALFLVWSTELAFTSSALQGGVVDAGSPLPSRWRP